MAKFNEPRPVPNLDIYDFEGQFESGYSSALEAHDLRKAAKQGDDEKLQTPFIKVQFASIAQHQRSYMVPNTVDPSVIEPSTGKPTGIPWAYPNVFQGSMEVSVVTNRNRADQKIEATHAKMRGLVRWISFKHDTELSERMKYLQVIQMLQKGSRVSVDPQINFDVTTITLDVVFTILPTAFPTPS